MHILPVDLVPFLAWKDLHLYKSAFMVSWLEQSISTSIKDSTAVVLISQSLFYTITSTNGVFL
jgi:hypothetical protein